MKRSGARVIADEPPHIVTDRHEPAQRRCDLGGAGRSAAPRAPDAHRIANAPR
ncbi:hypothetical protein BP1026B_II1676 [Burkholderia pseudomallei 1026b]|uniref:Uncharacterized protein n=1 Tax=Burkholderia pseudomallei (strain 1026b) TaxID=884204 RepID=A0A0H3HVH3_BURP2|nr:hypothetical protein BP1026B_II1676 [Burkholderia pseudomallei 1026b]EIF58479.1 hypothetical protein BP1026A_3362 [Burkholderia pseudomallei 1026a]